MSLIFHRWLLDWQQVPMRLHILHILNWPRQNCCSTLTSQNVHTLLLWSCSRTGLKMFLSDRSIVWFRPNRISVKKKWCFRRSKSVFYLLYNVKTHLIIHSPLISIFKEQAVFVIILPPIATTATVCPIVILKRHAVAPGPGALCVSVRAAHPGLGVLAPGVEDELIHLPGVDTGKVASCTLAPRL